MYLPDRFVQALSGFIGHFLVLSVVGSNAKAADDPPEPEDLVPGLIVEWFPTKDEQPRLMRRASTLVDRWGETVPDPRLPIEGFKTFWSGWLLIRESGDYRFRIDSDGPARLELGENTIESDGGTQILSESLPLRPGLVPIRFRSEHRGSDRRIIVDWTGQNFGFFEHLPPSQLFHDIVDPGNWTTC